jgi:hypothetical protein
LLVYKINILANRQTVKSVVEGSESEIPLAWYPSHTHPDEIPCPWIFQELFCSRKLCLKIKDTNILGYQEGIKIFLETVDEESRCATICLAWERVLVPLKYVYPVHPTIKHQQVLAFEEEHKGQEFKIMDWNEASCSVSLWAQVSQRRKTHFNISTVSLVVVLAK